MRQLNIQMVPGYIEMAVNYFEENKQVLEESVPALIHGDLTMVNILVDQGKISAILDFEYSMQAPIDLRAFSDGGFLSISERLGGRN